MPSAVVAVIASWDVLAALTATVVHQEVFRFFKRVRRVKLIVRRANFSNPCTRRIDRRKARGFATFMRRFRTHLVPVLLSRW